MSTFAENSSDRDSLNGSKITNNFRQLNCEITRNKLILNAATAAGVKSWGQWKLKKNRKVITNILVCVQKQCWPQK